MGRKRHMFRKKKASSERCSDKESGARKGYQDIVKENENFETFYKMQSLIPKEEWDTFMSTLKENLPAAFRITGFKGQAKALLNIIKGKYFDGLLKHKAEDKSTCRPFSLPWYPDNMAWQMNLSRVIIRTSEELQHLHNFLVSETATGNISRQETVSMIPPILLNVETHHKVLDMCAAPGSKTAQIIELIHKEDGVVPTGFVVANDVDNKRCYMLVHQAKRLNSPCILITNLDAAHMPNLKTLVNGELANIKYDRILCDVPCSGDGTIRKTPDIWQKWNTANANNLHSLQLKIAKRGLELLTVGGRMVYSTCSLNPIEDEAVIATLLQLTEGSVELIAVSHNLSGLKTCPGVTDWRVVDRDLINYKTFDDVPENLQKQIRPSMFPPSSESLPDLHLDRCFRILPHHQDTGGFFVGVLQKTKDHLPWESQTLPQSGSGDAHKDSRRRSPPRKKQRLFGYKEDPFIFLEENDEDWPRIRDFYDLQNFDHTLLLCRCKEGRKRNLYFVSESVKCIMQNNVHKVKVINTGVRMFCRSENKDTKCTFRLTQEGVSTLLPFMNKRKVFFEKDDITHVLKNEYTNNDVFSQEAQKQLDAIESGCVVLIYTGHSGNDEFSIEVCAWKGKLTLRCYVPKPERAHYLRICGVDVTDYERREKKKFKIKAEDTDEMLVDTLGDNEAVTNLPKVENQSENGSSVIKDDVDCATSL